MTKRWELDLRGLNDVEVPIERIRERSRREPSRGDPGPARSPRQRGVAAFVAFAVFIAAGAFAWRALRPTGPTIGGTASVLPSDNTIVATLRIFRGQGGSSGPSAILTTPTAKIDGTPTSYSWSTSQSQMNADTATPDFVNTDFVPVTVGSSLVVDSDAPAVGGALEAQGAYPFTQVQSFGQISEPVRLDQPPGRYILHLTPAWHQGTVNYYFPIDLVAPGPTSTSGPDAVLSFAAGDLPHASLSWGGTEQEAVRGGYDWCGRSNRCGNGTPDWGGLPPTLSYLPIPVGTSLSLDGDAIKLTGSFRTTYDVLQKVSDVTLDHPGTVPTVPGRYVLKLDVYLEGSEGEHGSATFFFGVDAFPGPVALDCDLSRGGSSGFAGANYASDEAAIRAFIKGIRSDDVIEPIAGSPERAYTITRGTNIIAWAKVGPGSSKATGVEFDACVGSGLSAAFPGG